MAQITGATNEKVYGVSKWLGLNEHPDGDTRLKMGEASRMVNWKITRDGNLKRRRGQEFIAGLCDSYTAVVDPDLVYLATLPGDYMLKGYVSYNDVDNPGTITFGTPSENVKDGMWINTPASVVSGIYQRPLPRFDAGKAYAINDEVWYGDTYYRFIAAHTAGDPWDDDEVTELWPYDGPDVWDGALHIQTEADSITGPVSEWYEEAQDAIRNGYLDGYIYIEYAEAVWMLTVYSFVKDGDNYRISGYRVHTIATSGAKPIAGMWTGLCGGKEVFLAACDGKVYSLWDDDNKQFQRVSVGSLQTDKGVSFFPFSNKVYILNGYEYYVFDGSAISEVTGYIPVIIKQLSPDDSASPGGTETGSYVNLLINKRKVWISPDGNTNKTFTLPEDITGVDAVIDRATGNTLTPITDYTVSDNQVTFTAAVTLVESEDAYEIEYTVPKHDPEASPPDQIPDYRAQVTGNRFAELFSGATDTAVFLYGDGTNRAIYTGMDEEGMPRADYFPDQYSVDVGDSNTPITAMVRHSGALVTFKTDSAWALTYSTMELDNGNATIAIYCTPLNKDKGNTVPGQVQLVQNNPITCSGTELYQWTGVSRYSSTIGRDERNARRISDRVQSSIKEVSTDAICMWDDNDNQEFYIAGNGIALVWNYALDAWYRYENFDAVRMCSFHGEVYLGSSDGRIRCLTDQKMSDEGVDIIADWQSGAMDFGAGNMRKYSSAMWVGLKPEDGTSVNVCVETDRKNTFKEKVVSSSKAKIPGQPFMVKTKLKAKKFVYYRLMLSVEEKMPAVTVTDVNILVRATGYAK